MVLGYDDLGRIAVIRWCHRHSVPCFLGADSNIRGDRATGVFAAIKRILVKRVVSWCTGVMPFGRLGRAYYEKYGADPDQIFYCPCEPDYDQIRGLSQAFLDQVAQKYGLDRERKRMIYSGRFTAVKRVDVLLEAFRHIYKERQDWDLILVGDGEQRESLLSMMPADMKQRVISTGFIGDQATVSALYRLSHLMVLPSDYEPWALVINEAAAAGLAIVATSAVGAAYELVRDGENGRVFAPGDKETLTQILLEVTQPQQLQAMRRASARVLEDWRAQADPVDGLRQALQACGVVPVAS